MIFEEQVSRKPNLYPWTEKFIEAMHGGFWTDKEFSFLSDCQDFNNRLSQEQKEMVVRTLSAIGQIEIAVKTFWAKLGENLPHPSLYDLGLVLANSEVIHNKAYERLLDVLGITEVFEENLKLEIIANRVKYLRKYTHRFYKDSKKQYIYALILFTMFVEGISLFSQFYVIKWFGRSFHGDDIKDGPKYLKDTNQQVNYTLLEESHISGTEILTPKGWVDLRLISEGDEVYQYHEDGSITETKVTKYHAYRHTGDIYSFEKTGYLCKVTPNHDIIYYNSKGKFIKRPAKDVKIHKEFFLPQGGVLKNEGGCSELSWEDRLRIAIQADGTTGKYKTEKGKTLLRGNFGGYTHSISLKKERKKNRLREILSKLDMKYIETPNDLTGRSVFKIYYNHNFDYKTLDWVDLSDKTSKWCKEFVDEAKNWDGSICEGGNICYSSSEKKCIDMVQTIATLAGYLTHINIQKYKKQTHRDNYRLYIRESDLIVRSHAIEKTVEKYDGMVYCVTVPSGNIITRLNDKMFIAGNCLHLNTGVQIIKTMQSEYPELFDDELKQKINHEAEEAFKAESKIIDWIVGDFKHENLSAEILKEFIKYRVNYCLKLIGFDKIFEVDPEILSKAQWFIDFTFASSSTDFFHQRPVGYSKKNKVIDEDSLFD